MDINRSYTHFAELSLHEIRGQDYHIQAVLRSSHIRIFAPPGGGIEPGTSYIATALAMEIYTLIIFEGCKQYSSSLLHISSVKFDEPEYRRLLATAKTAITLRGCEGTHEAV